MPSSSPAVELILARLRDSGDFPAMAKTVGSISALTSSEDTSISALADTVLQDYGLAQKLLRLVNTVAYAQHGQVTTVSRAVLLMGFDRVRTVATGLMLFEHLQAQAKSPALLDALNMSFYSAILGKTIADQTGFADKEEAFISALFHNLGRTLVALYLPAEVTQIRDEGQANPDAAVVRVLGMSYSSIGIGVAKAMNLPARLQQSMTRVTGSQVHASMTEEERLGTVATLSNGIADALATTGGARSKKQTIARLLKSYGSHFASLDGRVEALIVEAEKELHEHAKAFRLDLETSAFAAGLSDWRAENSAGALSQVASVTAAGGLVDTPADALTEDNPETALTQGLHEVTTLLVTEFTLDDVLRVILETIYRALGVGRTRAFFLLKDPTGARARFKFGMGQSAADMRTWMEVPLRGANDIFGVAIQQSRDLVIKDLAVPDLAALLPDWYRPTAAERRFAILLPLAINQKSVGLFYVDGTGDAARLLTPAVVNNLKVLRGQAALAIHQNTLRAAARKR